MRRTGRNTGRRRTRYIKTRRQRGGAGDGDDDPTGRSQVETDAADAEEGAAGASAAIVSGIQGATADLGLDCMVCNVEQGLTIGPRLYKIEIPCKVEASDPVKLVFLEIGMIDSLTSGYDMKVRILDEAKEEMRGSYTESRLEGDIPFVTKHWLDSRWKRAPLRLSGRMYRGQRGQTGASINLSSDTKKRDRIVVSFDRRTYQGGPDDKVYLEIADGVKEGIQLRQHGLRAHVAHVPGAAGEAGAPLLTSHQLMAPLIEFLTPWTADGQRGPCRELLTTAYELRGTSDKARKRMMIRTECERTGHEFVRDTHKVHAGSTGYEMSRLTMVPDMLNHGERQTQVFEMEGVRQRSVWGVCSCKCGMFSTSYDFESPHDSKPLSVTKVRNAQRGRALLVNACTRLRLAQLFEHDYSEDIPLDIVGRCLELIPEARASAQQVALVQQLHKTLYPNTLYIDHEYISGQLTTMQDKRDTESATLDGTFLLHRVVREIKADLERKNVDHRDEGLFRECMHPNKEGELLPVCLDILQALRGLTDAGAGAGMLSHTDLLCQIWIVSAFSDITINRYEALLSECRAGASVPGFASDDLNRIVESYEHLLNPENWGNFDYQMGDDHHIYMYVIYRLVQRRNDIDRSWIWRSIVQDIGPAGSRPDPDLQGNIHRRIEVRSVQDAVYDKVVAVDLENQGNRGHRDLDHANITSLLRAHTGQVKLVDLVTDVCQIFELGKGGDESAVTTYITGKGQEQGPIEAQGPIDAQEPEPEPIPKGDFEARARDAAASAAESRMAAAAADARKADARKAGGAAAGGAAAGGA